MNFKSLSLSWSRMDFLLVIGPFCILENIPLLPSANLPRSATFCHKTGKSMQTFEWLQMALWRLCESFKFFFYFTKQRKKNLNSFGDRTSFYLAFRQSLSKVSFLVMSCRGIFSEPLSRVGLRADDKNWQLRGYVVELTTWKCFSLFIKYEGGIKGFSVSLSRMSQLTAHRSRTSVFTVSIHRKCSRHTFFFFSSTMLKIIRSCSRH